MSEIRICKSCLKQKEINDYEKTGNGDARRLVCKTCRKVERAKRKDELKDTHHRDPNTVPKPVKCISCGKGPSEVEYQWRSDTITGSWRNECNSCFNNKGYSEKSRAKRREEDEAGYLACNAKSHLDWAKKNPEKIKEQQIKTATLVDRSI